ncbi:TPA: hypothetical protein ACV5ZF_004615 [Salmonella enterica]|uniref:Uncharacterized protein n=2 Tax=Salmonella enterica TaxID=28901 RepID=A0A3V4IVX3_SALER|nr:hypothetical protein [Salmonella enterica]ECC3554050.1 hypothetical protein [Salmonella enterica subsp. salamae]HCM1853281.1 hypothetical protein [Salmonella enterica subsp. salamae serovar 42:z29:-]AZT25069.1 hypothetical protein ELZ76_14550 [Salmonella enterica subsp. salamae serovar 42:r:-]AZT51301.1 hypothetical protein EL003_14520 [Salmonella enterica subsp. salamae serovar 42:r:-]AZT55726.1 hypothetical protein EL009_14565 [Salmonella enterica subsp. salamae serovar 42:r:-]
MLTETAAVLSAVRQSFGLLKTISEARDEVLVANSIAQLREKIIELQLLNAQLAELYHSERQRAIELAEKNYKIEMFTAKASNYELYKTSTGSIVYRTKPTVESNIGHHYLCAQCFEGQKISILQPKPQFTIISNLSFIVAFCPSCSTEFIMHEAPSESSGITLFDRFILE